MKNFSVFIFGRKKNGEFFLTFFINIFGHFAGGGAEEEGGSWEDYGGEPKENPPWSVWLGLPIWRLPCS